MQRPREGVRAVAILAAATLCLAAIAVLLPRVLGEAGGPEPELVTALHAAEHAGTEVPVPGSPLPLRARRMHFDRITVTEAGLAVSTLDFDGVFGAVEVGSLGRERTQFVRSGARWILRGSLAPTLGGAVGALAARARALADGDAPALRMLQAPGSPVEPELPRILSAPPPRWTVHAWYLRQERAGVTVTEDATFTPRGGAPERRLRRLFLRPSNPGAAEFFFEGSVL